MEISAEKTKLMKNSGDSIQREIKVKRAEVRHCNKLQVQNFSDKDIDIINFVRAFSKFYRRHFDIVSKYNVGLKTLLLQGLSEPEFYGDLVYKFRKIIGKIDFPFYFKKIVVRYKKIGYNINVMRQTACLVVNPIKINSFAYLFNCTTVGRTSD